MGDLYPKGVFCAALTPVDPGLSPDVLALARHCRWLIEQGCDGVALLGTTGEANSFSAAQRMRLLEGVIEAGVPAERLLPGTGCAALANTVELTSHAARAGVAGVVLLPPFYYKDVSVDGGVRREAQHSWALWQGSGREWQFGMERCRAGRI